MNRSFAFHPAARAELREAVKFYEREVAGLGGEFIEEVRATIERILDYPHSGLLLDPGVRRRLLARFPYSIIYMPDEDPVLIVAVMHQRRRPNYWLSRAPNP